MFSKGHSSWKRGLWRWKSNPETRGSGLVSILAYLMVDIVEPLLTVHIVTLFPNLFQSWLQQGVVARAVEKGIVAVDLVPLRQFGVGRHQITDDYPFGGGPGMVMKPEPLFD